MDGTACHFPDKTHEIAGFCIYNYQIFSVGYTPGLPQKRTRCLDADINFRLSRQRFHRSCFTKRPLTVLLTKVWVD